MKVLYIILGSLALGLGVVGIFLPLLPTTPLLLLAAWLYCKGSPRLYRWLLGTKYLGEYIRNFRENKSITIATKIVSVAMLWLSILYCIFFVVGALWLRIALGGVAVAVTYHILSFATLRKDKGCGEDR